MDTETILDNLMDAARTLGFTVRATKGNFRGGRCVVDGTPTIVLNTRHLPETRLRVLARALHDTPLETVYLKPTVRDALQAAWDDMDDVPTSNEAGNASASPPRDPADADDATGSETPSSISTSASVSAEGDHAPD